MSYVDENLLPGEDVVYRARLHPIVYAPAIVMLILAVLFFRAHVYSAGGSCIFIAAIVAGTSYIKAASSEFAVTNRRIIAKMGFLKRTSIELQLNKVEGIVVHQGLIGRIFNFGTIAVRGTGGSNERFPDVSAPLDLRKNVQTMLPT